MHPDNGGGRAFRKKWKMLMRHMDAESDGEICDNREIKQKLADKDTYGSGGYEDCRDYCKNRNGLRGKRL